MIAYINQKKDIKFVCTVAELVYQKAGHEPELCSTLVKYLIDGIDLVTREDPPIPLMSGGELFRRHLLVCYAKALERGRNADLPSDDVETTENATMGDHSKLTHAGLGHIRFLGELHKKQLVPNKFIHHIVSRLLKESKPNVEDVECLCTLLGVVGASIDQPEASQLMDFYFRRMKVLCTHSDTTSRMVSMIQVRSYYYNL